MSDLEIMRDYIESRLTTLRINAKFWLGQNNEYMYNQKMAKISELEMMENVLDEMEEEL